MPPAHRVFLMVLGNTLDYHKMFMENLKSEVNLREMNREDDCDVIIAFVPIVSRAGTDIQAAVERISNNKKPVILVVLHHTFDPNCLPPDSKLCVKRDRVFAVDCLFHEDKGLLRCLRNDDAIRAVKEHLTGEEQYEDWIDQEDENRPLVRQRRSCHEVESQELADRKRFLLKLLAACIVLCIIVGGAVGLMVGVLKGTSIGIDAGAGAAVTLVTIVIIVALVKYQQAGKKLYLSHTSH